MGKGGKTFLKKSFSLPSPNPIPPSPKTFVFIESLFRKCTAHRDRGIAGSEGAVRREAHPLHFLSKGEILQAFSGKNPNKQQAPSLGDEAHWGTVSVRPFVPGSAGTCRRIKKSWERGRGLGEGRKPFSGKVPPLPQKRIHRLQLLHIGIPRAGLLKELGGAAGEGVRILDVAVEQQGGVEKALDHFGKLRIVWIGL